MSNEVYKIALSIIGTLIPTVVIFIYLIKNVKFSRYKARWMFYLVVCGILAASSAPYLTVALETFWKNFMKAAHIYNKTSYNFVRATFCVALSEEFFKCSLGAMAAIVVLDLDSRYDAIFCSAVTALGFAITENLMYVYEYGLGTAVSRTFTAMPMHVIDGIIFGYFLAKMGFYYYKGFHYQGYRRRMLKNYLYGLFLSTMSHGFYDFLIFQGTAECQMVHRIFVIMMYVVAIRLVSHVSKTDKEYAKLQLDSSGEADDDLSDEIVEAETENQIQ